MKQTQTQDQASSQEIDYQFIDNSWADARFMFTLSYWLGCGNWTVYLLTKVDFSS